MRELNLVGCGFVIGGVTTGLVSGFSSIGSLFGLSAGGLFLLISVSIYLLKQPVNS